MPGVYIKIGDTLTCHCDMPLAKRTGQKTYELIRFHHGKKIAIEIERGLGTNRICCRNCNYKYTTISFADFVEA